MAPLAQSVSSVSKASSTPWRDLVEPELARVDQVILELTETKTDLITNVVRHIVYSGGKRLRPILTLLSSRLCGYSEGDRHVRLAACIEFIHTATLLHDDVVDESRLRRGSSTANEIWGNSASVLVGDFLLSRAFQLMARDGSLRVLKILSDTSAIITEGEVKQLSAMHKMELTEADYLDIVTAKTAELFAAACHIGGVITERPEQECHALDQFGRNLGIAFQIVDDALDYAADQQTLGKTIGDDFREGKVTMPVILAYQNGTAEERAFWQQAFEDSDAMSDEKALEKALAIIARTDAIRKTLQKAAQFQKSAQDFLLQFPASPERNALQSLLDFSLARRF